MLFFLVSLVPQILVDVGLFSVFPMLDMPYVPWELFYNVISVYSDQVETFDIVELRV